MDTNNSDVTDDFYSLDIASSNKCLRLGVIHYCSTTQPLLITGRKEWTKKWLYDIYSSGIFKILKELMGTRYSGDIVAGSLLLPESRKIAQLLLSGVDDQTWQRSIVTENILQKRSPEAARRLARLIRKRLLTMTPDLWRMVAEGTTEVATQAMLAAIIKDSRLLGDCLMNVVHARWRVFEKKLSLIDLNNYLDTCAQVDPDVLQWSEITRKKVRQIIIRILSEAGYLASTKSLKLLPVMIHPEVAGYLQFHKEDYVLKCMQATQ